VSSVKFTPKAQAISREINPIRPFEPEPVISNTHVLDEIAGLPHRCEHAALGDHRREIDNRCYAVRPSDAHGVIGLRYRIVNPVEHPQSALSPRQELTETAQASGFFRQHDDWHRAATPQGAVSARLNLIRFSHRLA
jgi:hypothetical protein